MHLTANDVATIVESVLVLAAGWIGWRVGHYRAYAECCDCCTCQTCTEDDSEFGQSVMLDGSIPLWDGQEATEDTRPARPTLAVEPRRHTILLEPGPTIYPALAELAGEVMDEPESHREPIDSTFVRKLLIEWEQRYPIPVGAP